MQRVYSSRALTYEIRTLMSQFKKDKKNALILQTIKSINFRPSYDRHAMLFTRKENGTKWNPKHRTIRIKTSWTCKKWSDATFEVPSSRYCCNSNWLQSHPGTSFNPPKTAKSICTTAIHNYTNVTLAIVSAQNTVVNSRLDIIIARQVSLFPSSACYEVTDFMLSDQGKWL